MDYQTLLNALRSGPSSGSQLPRRCALRREGVNYYLATLDAPPRSQMISDNDGAAIRQAIQKPWTLNLPGHLSLLRFLELPSTSPEELRAMARLQALPELPFPEDELTCDMAVLHADPASGRSRVLLAIARKGQIQELLQFCAEAFEWPDGFALNCLALREHVRRTQDADLRDYLHLDFSGVWSTIDVILEGELRSARVVPAVARMKDLARVVSECRQSLQRLGVAEAGLQRVLISGSLENMEPEFVAALEKELALKVMPLTFDPPEFPIAVAGALGLPTEKTLNLLPHDIQASRSGQRHSREWSTTLAWLGVWLVTLTLSAAWGILVKRRTLAMLEAQLHAIDPAAKKAEIAATRAAVAEDLRSRRALPLESLKALYERAPAGIQLRTFSFQPDGGLLLQGRASQLSTVMSYVNGLQQSPLFSQVGLHGSSLHEAQQQERVDFQIEGHLATPPSEFSDE